MPLETLVTDRHRQRDQRLDHLRVELGPEADGVDGRLLLEPAANLEPDEGVRHARAGAARQAEDVLAVGEHVGGHRGDERHLHLLDPRIIVGWDSDADVPLAAQRLRQPILADGVNQLFPQRPAPQMLRGKGHVRDQQQMIDVGLRGQGKHHAEEFAVELRIGHARLDSGVLPP